MTAYGNQDEAIAGLRYGLDHEVVSRIAAQKVDFGDAVYVNPLDPEYTGDGTVDQGTLSFSADFSASNSLVLTINGVAQTAIVYATSHAATFAAVVAQLVAAGLTIVSSDATARTIVVRKPGVALTISGVVTGGSAVTVTWTAATLQLLGVAGSVQKFPGYYEAGDAVNVIRSGLVFVPVADAINANAPAYLTSAKVWTDEASGNTATPYYFRKGTSGAGLALLEVIKKAAA